MAQAPEEYRPVSITVTRKQREFLTRRHQETGIPVSRTIRDALERAYPELRRDDATAQQQSETDAIPA